MPYHWDRCCFCCIPFVLGNWNVRTYTYTSTHGVGELQIGLPIVPGSAEHPGIYVVFIGSIKTTYIKIKTNPPAIGLSASLRYNHAPVRRLLSVAMASVKLLQDGVCLHRSKMAYVHARADQLH